MAVESQALPVRSFDRLFIGGRWVEPSSDRRIESISPATGEVLATVPDAQDADVDAAVAAARKAFDDGPWPHMAPSERAAALRRIGDELDARMEEIAPTFSAEIGAPLAAAKAFHQLPRVMWDAAADVLERYAFEETRETAGGPMRLVREPVGVVGTITPWNAPVPNASI